MAKKKAEPQPLRVKFDLRALIEKVNKDHGEGSIVLASEATNLSIKFIPSGCHAIDFATGGGIPENRITQIVGPYSSGKTTLVLKAVAEFQRKYKDGYAFFIDVENALDIKYAKRLGVDLTRLLVIRPDSGEQAVNILFEMLKQDVDIFGVVDSIPAIVPFAEIDASMDQNFVGNHPRLINRMVKICNARLKRSMTNEKAASTTIVLLNQIREKIGIAYGNPETTPGGRGKDFFSGLILTLRGSDKLHEEIERNGQKRKILVGRKFHATVTKNKVGGRPFEEAEYCYYIKTFGKNEFGCYDNESALIDFAIFHGVIKLSGKTMTFSCKHGTITYAKESAFIDALKKQPKVARSLYRAVMQKVTDENSDDAPKSKLVQEAEELVATEA